MKCADIYWCIDIELVPNQIFQANDHQSPRKNKTETETAKTDRNENRHQRREQKEITAANSKTNIHPQIGTPSGGQEQPTPKSVQAGRDEQAARNRRLPKAVPRTQGTNGHGTSSTHRRSPETLVSTSHLRSQSYVWHSLFVVRCSLFVVRCLLFFGLYDPSTIYICADKVIYMCWQGELCTLRSEWLDNTKANSIHRALVLVSFVWCHIYHELPSNVFLWRCLHVNTLTKNDDGYSNRHILWQHQPIHVYWRFRPR